LLESLPPIAGSGPTTPAVTGSMSAISSTSMDPWKTQTSTASTAGVQASSNLPFLSNQPTGAMGGFGTRSTLGVGLRPQVTGGGAANPFRASMAAGAFGDM
jgi:hypothetical protein